MEDVDELKTDLKSDTLMTKFDEMIEETTDDENLKEELMQWTRDLRDETVSLIDDVQDSDEIYTATVLRYIETKAKWITLNTHMQYQAVNTGEPDEEIMIKGSLLSVFFETLEEHIDEDTVNSITELLTQPVENLKEQNF